MDEYQGSGEWDFRGEDTKEYTHCLHIYPAMMIPQIARRLIELYGTKGGLLFDPYCGTGTSLVEARLYGMDAAGTDLNPTARMIAEAKTRDYDTEQLESDKESFLDGIAEQLAGVSGYEGFEEPEMVSFERLERWFPSRTIGEICTCMERVSMIEDSISRTFISVALSECLRLVSYQRNGEFKLYRIREDQREGTHAITPPPRGSSGEEPSRMRSLLREGSPGYNSQRFRLQHRGDWRDREPPVLWGHRGSRSSGDLTSLR